MYDHYGLGWKLTNSFCIQFWTTGMIVSTLGAEIQGEALKLLEGSYFVGSTNPLSNLHY